MTQELFSTSVPAGLEPGRSGFCTVAMTRNMPKPLVEMLESLSAYRPVFLPTDPRAADNPVTVAYLRVPVAGRSQHVLSRVCFAGQDYTSRSNRFAHHVVLESTDPRPPGGPAWLAGRPGFLETAFDGQVRWLPAGRAVPGGVPGSSACPTWQRLTGDAGWAGVLAEALANPAERSFVLIYDPGTDILPLIQESLSLLPPERRWEATFTTYFTGLPAGVGCTLRGVLRGSAEAASASASALLDLGKLAGKMAPVNDWTAAARAGKVVVSANRFVNVPAPHLAKAGLPPSPAQLSAAAPQVAAVTSPRALARPDALAFDEAPRLQHAEEPPRGVGKAVVLTLVASLVVLIGGVGTLLALRPDLFRHSHVAEKGDEDDKDTHDADKGGSATDKGGQLPVKKFKPRKPALVLAGDAPVAGKKTLVRVEQLDFPDAAPPFPTTELRFRLDGKELSAISHGSGKFEVKFDRPGKQSIRVEFPGDDRFDKFFADLPVTVLRPLSSFTIKAKAAKIKRGEKVEITLDGLPKDFTSFGLIRFADQRGELKLEKLPDGKTPIVIPDLKADKYSIKAIFPGDGLYGPAESSNAAQVRVQRTVELAFEMPSRDEFSFGRVNLDVTVKGSDPSDLPPKGTLQLRSRTEMLREGEMNEKGPVHLQKEELNPGKYELRLLFTPFDSEVWAPLDQPLPGPWQVIRMVKLKVSIEETVKFPDRVRFKTTEPREDTEDALPRDKKYHLAFRPSVRHKSKLFPLVAGLWVTSVSNQTTTPSILALHSYYISKMGGDAEIKGDIEQRFQLLGGFPKLEVFWRPSKEAWGGKKGPDTNAAESIITFWISEGTKDTPGTVRYKLENYINNRDDRAYIPLVPAYRAVVKSLHGAYLEVYEGGPDKNVEITTPNDKKFKLKTRDKKDKGALPLLRIKLLD